MWLMMAAVPAVGAGSGSGVGVSSHSTFQIQCAPCHGAGGRGDGWRAWLFRLQIHDFTDAAYMQTLSDDYLFQIIKQGGASMGKPGMPSWGQELADGEIRDLVAYIRGLAASSRPPKRAGATR